jgi:hypothetical protein
MDDETSIRLITTLNLRRLKYGVEEAEDGEEVIKVRCSILTPLAKKIACLY